MRFLEYTKRNQKLYLAIVMIIPDFFFKIIPIAVIQLVLAKIIVIPDIISQFSNITASLSLNRSFKLSKITKL
jgi:hypothetical protein